jgi:hypothetical protein
VIAITPARPTKLFPKLDSCGMSELCSGMSILLLSTDFLSAKLTTPERRAFVHVKVLFAALFRRVRGDALAAKRLRLRRSPRKLLHTLSVQTRVSCCALLIPPHALSLRFADFTTDVRRFEWLPDALRFCPAH